MADVKSSKKYTLTEPVLKLLGEHEKQPSFSGILDSALVQTMLKLEGKPIEDLLVGLLPRAASRAVVPISNYYVGAVLLGASGCVYFGSNFEVPGQGLGCSIHAEQSGFANAFAHDETEVKIVAVNAAPCGHCRQFMTEFSLDVSMKIIIKETAEMTLGEFLPEHFGPAHLGNKHGALPPVQTGLTLVESDSSGSKLKQAALDAAAKSYAPYSNSPSGFAILMNSGRIHSGSYIESVAYNPSLPPLQAALVSLVQSGDSLTEIAGCVLVELEGANITQQDLSRVVLKGLGTAAPFSVVLARKSS